MKVKQLTLRRLKDPSAQELYRSFLSIYQKLFVDVPLSEDEIGKLLAMAVLFTNQSERHMQRLGYRIVLAYGNKTKDFSPLYDIALNSGLMPVVVLLKTSNELPMPLQFARSESFLSNIVESYLDNFRQGDLVLTEEQYKLERFFAQNLLSSSAVVAPTSYGKSELIVSAIRSAEHKKVCVIVPTKSLLTQTRKRLLDAKIQWVSRIVSHPEMHRPNDVSSVYILTQERLTRILSQDKALRFDVVIVDEAHNLLNGDSRSVLLGSVIRILEFRNQGTAFKFLTPFLSDVANLRLKNSKLEAKEFRVSEYVKSESIYLADYRSAVPTLRFYDHFANEFIDLEKVDPDPISYLQSQKAAKNIVYLNRPKHIQEFAELLAERLPEVESPLINQALLEIGDAVDDKYLLLHCLRRGVLYHHGSMADPVRNYVEYLYRHSPEICYLVTSSTLLEGVNLPAEQMFLLSTMKGRGNLTRSQFKNLIGRVNRFSEIFGTQGATAISKLQPKIHVVASERYTATNANLPSFLEKVMRIDKKDDDEIENVLLEASEITAENSEHFNKVITRLENMQVGVTGEKGLPIVTTSVGLKLIENNVDEINVFEVEERIQALLSAFIISNPVISNSNTLMAMIYDAFVAFINEDSRNGRAGLLRLKSYQAQTFYAMFLDWRIAQTPFPVMIHRFIKYWESLPANTPVFVGGWGDESNGEDRRRSFTFMSNKPIAEKVNLAIVRIKEEEDFLDHVLFRFIEILNDLKLLDSDFYKTVRYGTTDEKLITMIKSGFSRGTSEFLLRQYIDLIEFREGDTVFVHPGIHRQMEVDEVSFMQRQEVALNVASAV